MRVLHFSDVHLSIGDLDYTGKLVNKMLTCIKNSYGENPAIDLVVFTGDLIMSGGVDKDGNKVFSISDGFHAFREVVIEPICSAFNIPIDHFIITMGNHDADWTLADNDVKFEISKSRYSENILSSYRKYIESDNAPWINDFNLFRDSLYLESNYSHNTGYANLVLPLNDKKVGVSIINSSWGSIPNSDNVLLNQDQLMDSAEYLDSQQCDYKICIMHNPFFNLNEDERKIVGRLLLQNYDACFTGHTHQQEDFEMSKNDDSCYLSIAPKLRSLIGDITENDRRYLNGFVIFEDNFNSYSITRGILDETHKFVMQAPEVTPKRYLRNIQTIKALLNLNSELEVDRYPFLISQRLDDIMQNLVSDKHQFIRLSALSGFGKTRLIYETFKQLSDFKNTYYCETYPDNKIVFNEIKAIVESHPGENGLIILDNCNWSLMSDAIEYMRHRKTPIRLIAIDNNPYDYSEIPDCYSIILPPDIIKPEVDEYIDNKLAHHAFREIKEDVKMLADGYPYMANRLIDICQVGGVINVASINDMVRKMLYVNGKAESNDDLYVLQAMALFQPMPTLKCNAEAYNYVVNSSLITHLSTYDPFRRKDIFRKVIRRYSPILIDQTSDWLCVRPYPLAIWLIQERFEVMDEVCLQQLVDEIQQQSDDVAKLLSNSLCKRIESMQDSIPAKILTEKLTSPGKGSFCSEKVVCSEMGSRLFLAMSAVNPKAVANCLRYIFSEKDTEWIKSNIKDGIRRNLVCALNKLCFAKESYDDAVVVLAQLAEAENEHWANNSRNEFRQLFHVYLAGTEVDLSRRLKTIEELCHSGYMSLAIGALDSAFLNHHFNRMGGAEKFGWRHREEYVPQNKEIIEYWDGCIALLLSWYEKSKVSISDICKIAESHINDWNSYWLMQKYLFTIIDEIAPTLNWQWKKMYELLIQLVRYAGNRYSEEELRTIEGYISKLEPKLFSDTLLYTSRKVFHRKDNVDLLTRSHELFEPLAKQFVTKCIYQNSEEVNALLRIKSGIGLFLKELKGYLNEDMLRIFFNHVWDILIKQGDEFDSNFVNGILLCYRDSVVAQEYLQKLEESGFLKTYSRTMAYIEDGDMTSYSKLLSWYKNNKITYEHIEIYLKYLGGLTNEQMSKLLPSLMHDFPNNKESILEFLLNHHFDVDLLMDNLHSCLRELLINVNWVNESGYCKYEVISLVKEYLEKLKDDLDFAIQVNNKIIATLSNGVVHNDEIGDLYCILLQEPYQNVIWDNFVNALSTNKSFLWNIKFSIGSGFSFGAGPLFQFVSDQKIKSLCDTNNDLIYDLANMAPVFKYDETSKIVSFSDFLIWVIDKYGEQRNTLSGISSNMQTMSWTGSPIPLYNDMIRVLTPYISHHNLTVQQWAKQEIEQLEEQIAREKSQDDYMRMHYT